MKTSRSQGNYLHGSEPTEQRRLSGLNDLLNQACLRELTLAGDESILDVGSGLGQFTRLMAREVRKKGGVLGIERDPKQLAAARRKAKTAGDSRSVEWRQGDATALPLAKSEIGRFDLAHTRWVLEHVPEPLRVVRQMVQSVRRGGRIILADDDHEVFRLFPEPPGFSDLWQSYIRAFEHLNCDPFVGRKLLTLLHEAGAKPVRNSWIFFGSSATAPEFQGYVDNLIGVIQTARKIITGPLGFAPKQFDRAILCVREWSRRPDAAIWYSLCWAEGVRK